MEINLRAIEQTTDPWRGDGVAAAPTLDARHNARATASPPSPRRHRRGGRRGRLTCDLHAGSEVKTQGSSSLGQVIIKHNATTVIAVKQRDLFSKYRWPAAPKILERLEMLKEDLED